MSYTSGHGAKIYYETMGPEDGIPVLLIQGYTAQMIGWRDGFCQALVERGLRVIRFDNRDVGLSEKFGGPLDLDGGYGLADMAADGFRVMDALGLPRAHVVGQSMGGMIAQVMAGTDPDRVSSLSLIYTAPGMDQRFFVPSLSDGSMSPVPVRLARADAIENYVGQERMAQSTDYAFNETWIRELGALAYDRCYAPDGGSRQWRAMMRWSGDFADHARMSMPVAVIHGRTDRLVKVEASIELGTRMPHSEVHLYPGMGHEVVEPLWSEFAGIIQRTIRRAAA
jgi:pimeloyl-ACP methyl ester carboxylesterase